MTTPNASASGTFSIGNIKINRLGYGAMRITGAGIWNEPADRSEALRTLKRLPELGVNFIDTAASYGPDVSERLIKEALYPYKDMLIATKGGLERPGPDQWVPNGRPEALRADLEKSLKLLGVERIDLWQLHRVDPGVPADEQFGAVAGFIKEGLVQHAGLSEVAVADIQKASKQFKVVTVQNHYNLANREHEAVLDHCEKNGIGFIPWYPLASGELAKPGSPLDRIAHAKKAGISQIALAWTLKRSPVMLPIPGTSKVKHLEENVAAASISLSDAEYAELDRIGKRG